MKVLQHLARLHLKFCTRYMRELPPRQKICKSMNRANSWAMKRDLRSDHTYLLVKSAVMSALHVRVCSLDCAVLVAGRECVLHRPHRPRPRPLVCRHLPELHKSVPA